VNSGAEFAFRCSVTLRAYIMRLPYDSSMSFTAADTTQLVQRTPLYYLCQATFGSLQLG
jgi:hypothetical protein